MASRKPKADEANVPLSAMIDVVFLLLIYFVVTQKPIVEDVHLSADLPSPNRGKPPPDIKPPFKIDVIDDADPNLYRIDGRKLDFSQIAGRLATMSSETTVIINCDPNARHEKLIRLLDELGSKDFKKLNITNDMSVSFRF